MQDLKSTYKRHGTLNLFAALNVAKGVVKSKTTEEKKRKDFQTFLDEDFVAVYHENAKPFVWKKREVKGSQLRTALTNLIN